VGIRAGAPEPIKPTLYTPRPAQGCRSAGVWVGPGPEIAPKRCGLSQSGGGVGVGASAQCSRGHTPGVSRVATVRVGRRRFDSAPPHSRCGPSVTTAERKAAGGQHTPNRPLPPFPHWKYPASWRVARGRRTRLVQNLIGGSAGWAVAKRLPAPVRPIVTTPAPDGACGRRIGSRGCRTDATRQRNRRPVGR